MDPISDELQAPDGDEDQPEEAEAGKNCNELAQNTLYSSNYNQHHYEEPQDFTAKSLDNFNVANAISTAESHKKVHSERVLQDSSRTMKAKRRKAEMFEVHSGRIIRSTSRKDRHSKVCTTRGPKDRRVRLSPTTAIQFYDVQDRLGYDRPSKAIDWLMNEAKTAIEALNDSQAFASYKHLTAPKNHSQMPQGSASGMIQKHESSNNAENPVSSFGVFVNGDAAPLPITDDFNSSRLYQEQGFLSALSTTSHILDANLEMAKLQRIFTWNYDDTNAGDATPLQYPSPPGLSHSQMFSQREPLQSSFINYSTVSNESPRLNFYSEELSNFTAATFEESEKDKIPVCSKNSSAYFLHMED